MITELHRRQCLVDLNSGVVCPYLRTVFPHPASREINQNAPTSGVGWTYIYHEATETSGDFPSISENSPLEETNFLSLGGASLQQRFDFLVI